MELGMIGTLVEATVVNVDLRGRFLEHFDENWKDLEVIGLVRRERRLNNIMVVIFTDHDFRRVYPLGALSLQST